MPKDKWYDRIIEVFTPYGGSVPVCPRCFIRPAVAVHEIEPRSVRPADWEEPDNRVPLCGTCHAEVHEIGARAAAESLQSARAFYLDTVGKTEDAARLQRDWLMERFWTEAYEVML